MTNVRTLCVRYRDLKYGDDFIFPAKRLPNAEDPPKVLKPEDLANRGANFTPRFGFGERKDRAQLDQAGHRMINHHSQKRDPGAYAGQFFLVFQATQAQPSTFYFCCCCVVVVFPVSVKLLLLYYFAVL